MNSFGVFESYLIIFGGNKDEEVCRCVKLKLRACTGARSVLRKL